MIRNILSHAKLSSYHPIERYYWIFSIFVVFGMSFIPISSFVFKFLTNPINVSVDRNYFHFNLTFPSVTLCLHDRLNETAMNEFVSSNEKISKKQLVKFLFDLAYFDIDSNLDQLTKFTKIHPNEYIPILLNISNNMNGMMIGAYNKSYQLYPILTEIGLCYTFNSKFYKVFNPITYYDKHRRNKDVEIYKVNFFDIETEASLSYQYIGSNFDIYLHGQMELPSRKSVIRTERGQASYIKLLFTTHAITSDSNVKSLAIFQRKCRFDDESNLLYFPGHYSPSLCQLNCKLSAYEKHCGCIPFFYHYVTPETNQCSHSGLKCIHKKAQLIEMQSGECKCLTSCNDEKLLLKSSNAFYWAREPSLHLDLEKTKTAYRRQVIFGWRELLVASGATAGLFLGISVLALVEFIYLNIRPWLKHFVINPVKRIISHGAKTKRI